MRKLTKNVSGYMAIVSILVLYVVNTLVYKLIPTGDSHDWAYYMVSGVLLFAVAVFVPMLFGFDIKKRAGIKERLDVWSILLTILLGCNVMVFGLGYSNILFYLLDAIGYTVPSSIPVMNSALVSILGFFCLAILPALGEEFLLRGSMLPSLRSNMGTKKAILWTSLFFALMHGSVAQFGHQFLVGIACAIVVIAGRSVWYGVILHVTNNAITVALNIASSQEMVQVIPTPAQFFTSFSFVICLALCLLGLIGAYLVVRTILKRRATISGGEVDKGIFTTLDKFDSHKIVSDYEDRGQNVLFFSAMIGLGVLVVVDLVLVLFGVVL